MTRILLIVTAIAATIPLTGCAKKPVPVSGAVTLDGKAVEGATVTFTSDDGQYTASGVTDVSGNFSLACTVGPGAYPGNYKVTVAKYPRVDNAVSPTDQEGASNDYVKHMKKEMESSKEAGITKTKMPSMKMPGGGAAIPTPSAMMPGASKMGSAVKSELPETYASLEKTPLTAKVPPDGPVQLQLKAKP